MGTYKAQMFEGSQKLNVPILISNKWQPYIIHIKMAH